MARVYPVAAVALLGAFLPLGHARAPVPREKAPPEVHVVGVYEGSYPPGVQHRAGFHPPGAVTVKVGPGKKPVVLVLTAYEPVVWKVEAPREAVARVIASGQHKQLVEGVEERVPVTLISYEAGDKGYYYMYPKDEDAKVDHLKSGEVERRYRELAVWVKELTGAGVQTFRGGYSGARFEVR